MFNYNFWAMSDLGRAMFDQGRAMFHHCILFWQTSPLNVSRRSVEHCTPHAVGAWLNELG